MFQNNELFVISWAFQLSIKKGYLKRTLVFHTLFTSLQFLPETLFSDLLIDYEKVLELDANNFEAKNELKKIDQVITLIGPNIS